MSFLLCGLVFLGITFYILCNTVSCAIQKLVDEGKAEMVDDSSANHP